MAKRYRVTLSADERERLERLSRQRTASVRMVRRAEALLLAADEKTDEVIAEQLRMSVTTLERLRRRFVEEGLEASLRERPRPGARPKLGPKEQAFVVALACTKPPEGRHRWTMQMLADRLVELEMVPDITDEAIRLLLKRTSSGRGCTSSG
jgi:transposase